MIIFLFGITIFIHELGHFLAARWMGLVVDAFSIGMGPAIWKKKHKGVVYRIGCLPIGGYVALPQLDPSLGKKDSKNDDEKPKRELPALSPWRKIPVQLAGVTGNVVLAFIIAVIIYFAASGPAYDHNEALVGFVDTNSVAYAAGIRIGDNIKSVNGDSVGNWEEFIIDCVLVNEVELAIVGIGGEEKSVTIATKETSHGGRTIFGLEPSSPCFVLDVTKEGSAMRAGMRAGDIIIKLNNTPVMSMEHLSSIVDAHLNQELPIEVLRGGEKLDFTVLPEYNVELERALIGITFNPIDIKRKPLEQIERWGRPVFRILKAFVTPAEAKNAASSISGPVSIFRIFWMSVRTSFLLALWLTGMININLAILNILPIPILDGGHLFFTVVEIVTRKPINARFLMVVYQIFIVLLITMMVLVTFNDIRTIFTKDPGLEKDRSPAAENAVPVEGDDGESE